MVVFAIIWGSKSSREESREETLYTHNFFVSYLNVRKEGTDRLGLPSGNHDETCVERNQQATLAFGNSQECTTTNL
jgi:hypothetical protein